MLAFTTASQSLKHWHFPAVLWDGAYSSVQAHTGGWLFCLPWWRFTVVCAYLPTCVCVCASECACGWGGHFRWPAWHLTHTVASVLASFSVSLTCCSASGTEKSATLSSAAGTQHLLCFCLLCSSREAAAGEGDRPEDSGGRSQRCKLRSTKIYVVCVF